MHTGMYRLMVSVWVLLLLACSPPQDSQTSPKEGSAQVRQTALSKAVVDGTEAELLAQGWRAGTLEIRITAAQGGVLKEESSGGGGIQTSVEWSFNLEAQRLLNVLVMPDLSVLIPPTGSDEERRAAFTQSPIYISQLAPQPAPRGQVSYRKRMVILSPESANYSEIKEITAGQGGIRDLQMTNLRPSFYGRGYELELFLAYTLLMNSTKAAQPVSGSPSHVEEELPVEETLAMHLFPAPDLQVLESYPFPAPSAPQDKDTPLQQLARDRFQTLQDAYEGVTLIGELRPGMRWKGTRDRLELSYLLTGNSQPPLFGDVTGLATQIEPNTVEVRVTIKALK